MGALQTPDARTPPKVEQGADKTHQLEQKIDQYLKSLKPTVSNSDTKPLVKRDFCLFARHRRSQSSIKKGAPAACRSTQFSGREEVSL